MKKPLSKGTTTAVKQDTATEKLAIMVKNGFDDTQAQIKKGFKEVYERFDEVDKRFSEVYKRFSEVDKRFDEVDGEFAYLKTKISAVEREISAIRHDLVHREEFEDLMARMKLVELKLGIMSGK